MNSSFEINRAFGIFVLFVLLAVNIAGQKPQFDRIFDYYKTRENFSGVALAATDGKVDYLNGAGLANRQDGTALTVKSKFRICSVTKTFTTVLIMQLAEQGKISLDAPVSKYLSEYKGEGKDKITIENLLTYSSGIDNIDQREDAVYSSLMSPDALIEKYFSGKLTSEPGTKFSYKNADFIILGKIVEKLTGKPFAAALDENILKPLEMTNTGYLRNADIVPNLATPYLFDKPTRAFRNDDPYWIDNFYSAGAMYSTAEDLLKFDRAIFSARILSKKTIDLMLTPHPSLASVGYGFWISPVQFGTIKTLAADRQGGISGSNATWLHLIDRKKTVIILSNSDATNINEMREKFMLALLNQPINLPQSQKARAGNMSENSARSMQAKR